jgi:NAD(P)-dependent dehydrogenase (short-subunit alcohol dehydrogenase family)
VRLDDARRELDDLRDYASADDYRTIRVRGKNGRAAFRRVPTEEFAARIERAELEKTLTPIGRRLDPSEIARVAVFLASNESAAITGQAWNVDGGAVPS